MSRQRWMEQLFDAIDAQDVQRFMSFLAPDCRFRFGNLAPVVGRAEVEEFVSGFFASIDSLAHRVVDSWDVPDGLICHGIVSYTRHDQSVLTVPFANVLKTTADGVSDYLIFADTSALFG